MKIQNVKIIINTDMQDVRLLEDRMVLKKMRQCCRATNCAVKEMGSMRGAELLRALDSFEEKTSHMLFRGGYLAGVRDAIEAAMRTELVRNGTRGALR